MESLFFLGNRRKLWAAGLPGHDSAMNPPQESLAKMRSFGIVGIDIVLSFNAPRCRSIEGR